MNMQKMLQQAQQMQKKFQEAQDELAEKSFSGQAGGGMVSVTINGQGEIEQLDIDPEVVDPEDVEILEDMILSAVENAHEKLDEAQDEQFGDMGLPMDQMGNLGDLLG